MRVQQLKTWLLPCLLMATFCMPSDALATDYFVRKTGNNGNAGTAAGIAWLTIDYAADNMSAGDTVYVGAGTYSERVTPSQSGASGSPIRFIADTDGSQTGDAGDILVTGSPGLRTLEVPLNKDYLEFYKFKFQGFAGDAVRFYYADGGLLDNCELYSGTQGLLVTGSNNLTVQNCIIHDNSSDGVNTSTVSGMLVAGCEIYGNVTGIDVDSGGVTIRNCLLRDNSARGIDVTVGTVVVQNCTVVNNTTDGIHEGTGTLTVTNCIIANNGDDGLDYDLGTITHSYNLFYGNSGLDLEGTSLSTGEISVDPEFVSSTDYRIRSFSPAVNAGTDLTGTVDDDIEGRSRPYGSDYDMGCYEQGPLAHWKYDETSGTTAFDSSGFGHDGTHSGSPTWSLSGMLDGSLDFETSDGNDRIDAGNFDVVGTGLTIITWVRQEEPLNDARIIMKSDGNGTSNQSWGITIDELGELDMRVTAGGSWDRLQAPGVISADTWHLVAGTYDGTTMRLYVDGVLVASSTHTSGGAIAGNSSHTVTVGDTPIGSRPFDGLIDDARIYSYALNAAEITALNVTGSSETLVGHWKLDEISGTTAADSSTYGNDGTVSGTTVWVEGVFDNALDMDKTTKVTVPGLMGEPVDFTIACWAETRSSDCSGTYCGSQLVSVGDHFEILSHYNLFDSPVAGFHDGSTYVTVAASGGSRIEKGWHHYAVTFNDALDELKIYVDGKLSGTLSTSSSVAYSGLGSNTAIGANGNGNVNYDHDGPIDDVRIYNQSLSATEIAELYGLMGHWKMDEGSGATAADSTAFANDATLYGATWTTDCAGNSGLEFDGISDTAATNADFDPPERGAIAMWFRSDGPPASQQTLWGVGDDFEMWQDTDGLVSCDVSTDGFQGGFITTDPLHMDGRWYHLIAEYDSDDDSYAIYINGELHKSGISTWAMTKQAASTLTFGTRTGITEYFDGGIRDFRIYNRPLTASEKSELSGLAAYWKLDETSGTVAVDSSSNGHDGTLVGSPTWTTAGNLDGALDFENSDGADRIDAGTFDVSGSAISTSAWVRPEGGGHDQRIVFKSSGNNAADQYWGLTVAESLEPDFRVMAGGTWDRVLYTGAVSTGKWYYLAGTYDGTTMRLYVNGIEVASKVHSAGGALDEDSTVPVTLGDSSIGARALDGQLDDVRIFSRTLCPTEIYGQYKTGRPSGIRILKWVEVR